MMIRKVHWNFIRKCSFSANISRSPSVKTHSSALSSLEQNFVDGRRCMPANSSACNVIENFNPATGKVVGVLYSSRKEDVDNAVKSAKEAFQSWSETPPAYRSQFLRRAGRLISHRVHDIAKLEAVDTGKTLSEATFDVQAVVEVCNYFASMCYNLIGQQIPLHPGALIYTRKEPIGVCGGIGAWNFPINNITWKVLPALACGNTCIYKPSPLTPITSTIIAEILCEAGLPPGCLNIIQGGADIGELLCTHEDVSKISFTGSIETGAKVMASCAPQIKNVTLELGGKSPMIVFEDADMENAVQGALMANFLTQGEVCSNGARVYVHESIFDEFVEKVVNATRNLRIGDTLDGRSQIGALISQDHMEKVMGCIDQAVKEGVEILCGGTRPDFSGTVNEGGYYLTPCVMTNCHDDMEIIKEEHFGPIMSVLKFSSEVEVITRANNTKTGLAGGVFTRDISRGHRVIAKLQAGSCCLNTYNMYPVQVPFGGFKMSGIGQENGTAVLRHYTQEKTVYVELNDVESSFL